MVVKTDRQLLDELKKYRIKKSTERHVPLFMIFSNKTLNEIVYKKPKNLEDLLKVYGFGFIKLKDYASDILSIINECDFDIKHQLNNLLISFNKDKNELLNFGDYICKSEIIKFKKNYKFFYDELKKLLESNQIEKADLERVKEFILNYDNFENIAKKQNEKYIEYGLTIHKDYLDNILKVVDEKVILDEQQRRAIISDEDYCLLVAGAGAGKTTTMAAKVKYLVDKKKINPREIIVISYTNKAIDELKERINDKLNIPAKITTFHAFGYDIIKSSSEEIPTIEYSAFKYVFDCLEKQIFDNKKLLENVILFLGYYLNIPEDALKFATLNEYYRYKSTKFFETIKSNAGDFIKNIIDVRSSKKRTLTGEFVKSNQEVQIANYLYMNGINYEYEKRYPFRQINSKKVYTPDFTIMQDDKVFYLEHFGISQNFQNNLFSEKDLEKYKKSIIFKRKLHKSNDTKLIETYSFYNDRRDLLFHLKEELLKFGIKTNPRSNEELYKKIVETSKDKHVYKFGTLILEFIARYKACGYNKDGFKILRQKQDNVRTNLFLDIVEEIYNYYQNKLKEKNSIDFADMINNAEELLKESESSGLFLPYKYIIIDEFQDIAKQRFNLTKTLANITQAKIVAVGDDWQSIFAFAGSDITLFQKFEELMGWGLEMEITHTYRNSQELIDIAGEFVQKNPMQKRKKLKSPKRLENPIEIIEYDDTEQKQKKWIESIDDCIDKIVKEYGSDKDILLISRYGFEKYKLTTSEKFLEGKGDYIISKKNPQVKIMCLTAHSSKGLGFDNVIILNMQEAIFGFPSQIDDDPILKLVTTQDNSIPYAEERRLFYVALTRTKNKVFMITPQKSPSQFVIELVNDFKLRHSDQLELEITENDALKCPLCDSPLKFQSNNQYGLPLYMCCNDPEICDFMTNNKYVLADIYKCSDCNDGYMIVKKSEKNDDYFYGCTDYPSCRNQNSIPNELKNKVTKKKF